MGLQEEKDWLEKLLGKEEPYIDDGGFTNRVLQSLPPPDTQKVWLKPTLLVTATACSSLLAAILLPSGNVLVQNIAKLVSFNISIPGILIPAGVVMALTGISWIIATSEI